LGKLFGNRSLSVAVFRKISSTMMERSYLYRVLCALLFLSFSAMPRSAAVLYARSGDAADIHAAINGASTGDTISVPAGRYSFEGVVYAPDGIYIRGPGETRLSWSRATIPAHP
jgi:hypothetical protein